MGSYTVEGQAFKCRHCRKELLMNPEKRSVHEIFCEFLRKHGYKFPSETATMLVEIFAMVIKK
jgi:hypothetical protein